MNQRLISGTVRVVAFSAAMLLLTMLVVTRSQAAFTASTSNTGNGFTAGDLSLFDDDNGTAMFNATGMVPGATVTECITVTYDGDVTPAPVRLYGTGTGALAQYLDLTIEVGTGGSSASCSGFGGEVSVNHPHTPATISRKKRTILTRFIDGYRPRNLQSLYQRQRASHRNL